MNHYGTWGIYLHFVQSYLAYRKMSVNCKLEVGTCKSNYSLVYVRCPQGSILGPLYFTIFSNDLFIMLTICEAVIWADDTSLLHAPHIIYHILEVLQQELLTLLQLFHASK